MLLVHGFASSTGSSWRRGGWIDALEGRGRTVIAPDLPGHGLAEKPIDPAAYGSVEEEIYAHVAGRRPADGVGFSLGARIVLSIEADHPGTFGRLVLGGIGANVFSWQSPEKLAFAIEARDHHEAPGNPLAEALVRGANSSSNSPAALTTFLRRPQRRRISVEDLVRIACPVLVVVGEGDTVVHPVSMLTDRLADVRVVTVPSADHLRTMRSPLFLEAALEFLCAVPA